MQQGADFNTQDNDGLACIHAASYFPNLDMMDMLIENQACDINIPTRTGETPLHFAVLSGSLDAVITLLNAGVDIHAQVCSCCGLYSFVC
jgi:ankyrin repeat protein